MKKTNKNKIVTGYNLLVIIIIFISFCKFTMAACNIENDNIRAVSLKILQQEVEKCQDISRCSKEVLELGRLTEVMGYVFDERSKDIILLGCVNSNLPAIYTKDFVVALKNAWMDYAEMRGNTYYYSNPGCSIDPDPNLMQELVNVGNKILSSSMEEADKKLDEWHNVCKKPQNVRVLGIPFDTHFAKIMVKADYDMKNLVDGTDEVGIPGFRALMNMKIDEIREDIRNNRQPSVSISMNRFWFYPGENIYEEDNGIVVIKKCPVTLLTENEYSSSGSKTDPLAKKFTENVTVFYKELAQKRLIYKELENLFHLVAIAKILEYRNTNNPDIENILSYFLNSYIVPENSVEKRLPGRSSINKLEDRKEYPNGYQLLRMWLPSCGGVDIAIKPEQKNFVNARGNSLFEIKRKVLATNSNTLYWDINSPEQNIRLFSVKYDPATLTQSKNAIKKAITEETEVIYLDMENFPNETRMKNFITDLKTSQTHDIKIKYLDGTKISKTERDAFLNGDVISVDLSDILTIKGGKMKFRAEAKFNLNHEISEIKFDAFSERREIINKVFIRIKEIYRSQNYSPAKIINQSIKALKDSELKRLIIELKGNQIVIDIKKSNDKWAFTNQALIKK